MHEGVNDAFVAEFTRHDLAVAYQVTTQSSVGAIRQHSHRLDNDRVDDLTALRLEQIRNGEDKTDWLLPLFRDQDQFRSNIFFDGSVLSEELLFAQRRVEKILLEAEFRDRIDFS